MLDLKACTVCFSTNVKLHNLDSDCLRNEYNKVSGLKTVKGSGLPNYLCMECCAYVKKSYKFRLKCQRAFFALQEILNINKEIKLINLKLLDTTKINIGRSLSYLDSLYTETKFIQLQPMNRDDVRQSEDSCENATRKEIEIKHEVEDPINKDFASQFETFLCNPTVAPKHDECSDFYDNNDNINSNDANDYADLKPLIKPEIVPEFDGSELEEEYARMIPLSITEAKVVVQIEKLFSKGKYKCTVCNTNYETKRILDYHSRMHDKQISGSYECAFCLSCYKTNLLLRTHMIEEHMYKYLCKKCPEVLYDRSSAKQHYVIIHVQNEEQSKNNSQLQTRPKRLTAKGVTKHKAVVATKPRRKIKKLLEDFFIYKPITHEEQYTMIKERQSTRNYKESHFKCESCYRGFRKFATYSNHMKKHDSAVSGKFMCDMCKLFFPSPRKMYKHMNITHLYRYNCQLCSFVCYNKFQAHMHYKWHKNITYTCPHCNMEFKKISTQLTHIRKKHPSTFICTLCGNSYVSEVGLVSHKKMSHSKVELVALETPVDTASLLYCGDCDLMFANEAAFATHLTSSNKHAHLNQ